LAGGSSSIREWLLEEFPANLVQAFEAMVGVRPEPHLEAGKQPAAGALLHRQKFEGLEGAVWLAAAETDWIAAGNEVLRAAGIEDGDQPTLKSTYLETIGQGFSSLASSITARVGSEVTCAAVEESAAPADLSWFVLRLSFPSVKVLLELAFETVLVDNIRERVVKETAASEPQKEIAEAAGNSSMPASKTFDLLLDVELPVSVSFGRAQVLLKDLIKLTTGSIVELNRSITEPVEVIVNNCVIARGEVVVVEGNFGVRIQQVVSRQERLRTLA
jgi:flagellar motor switch protein FliN/FliY